MSMTRYLKKNDYASHKSILMILFDQIQTIFLPIGENKKNKTFDQMF